MEISSSGDRLPRAVLSAPGKSLHGRAEPTAPAPRPGVLSPFPGASAALHPPQPRPAAPPALELPSPRLNPQGAAAAAPRPTGSRRARPGRRLARPWRSRGAVWALGPRRGAGAGAGAGTAPQGPAATAAASSGPGRAGPIERAAPG